MNCYIQACKELFFPTRCLKCGRQLPAWEPPIFCDECLAGVAFIGPPVCVCCGVPFAGGRDHLCGQCLLDSYYFQRARSALHYREPVAPLLSRFKFQGDLTGLATLAALAKASTAVGDLSPPDIVAPVPLHKDRLRTRSFNQSLVLAQAIFHDYRKKIIPDLLGRNRATRPQTGLSGMQRRRNLSRAFSVKRPQIVPGRKILLIDDVFTTGSTVNECSRILLREGAATVEVFTLARAV